MCCFTTMDDLRQYRKHCGRHMLYIYIYITYQQIFKTYISITIPARILPLEFTLHVLSAIGNHMQLCHFNNATLLHQSYSALHTTSSLNRLPQKVLTFRLEVLPYKCAVSPQWMTSDSTYSQTGSIVV